MERDVLEKLLSQYRFAKFDQEQVEMLLSGQKLPTTANTTLLDIEQSLKPANEMYPSPSFPQRANDNVE